MTNKDTLLWDLCDTHCGSKFGLMIPDPFIDYGGDAHYPTYSQKIIWEVFKKSIDRVAVARRRKRLIIVLAGDLTEGIHHAETDIISPSIFDHVKIFKEALKYALKEVGFNKKKGDQIYFIRGSIAHGGKMNEAIQTLADGFGGVPDPDDHTLLHTHLLLDVNGLLYDYAHEGIRVGYRQWTEANNIRYHVLDSMMERIATHHPIPRTYKRAHLHKFVQSGDVIYKDYISEGVVLPAFKTKDDWTNRKFNRKLSHVGSIWDVISADGKTRYREHEVLYFEQSNIIKA